MILQHNKQLLQIQIQQLRRKRVQILIQIKHQQLQIQIHLNRILHQLTRLKQHLQQILNHQQIRLQRPHQLQMIKLNLLQNLQMIPQQPRTQTQAHLLE